MKLVLKGFFWVSLLFREQTVGMVGVMNNLWPQQSFSQELMVAQTRVVVPEVESSIKILNLF